MRKKRDFMVTVITNLSAKLNMVLLFFVAMCGRIESIYDHSVL